MNTFKKIISLLLLFCLCVPTVVSCAGISGGDGVSIVSTIFAPFDFARSIAGERANVKMLLQPGADSHSYDPTPKDMVAISKCDIFIYTGSATDAWVEEILFATNNPDMKVIKLMDYTEGLICSDADHSHDHDHEHSHGEYDEHVWTSPRNASLVSKAIADALCEVDAEGAEFYTQRLAEYQKALADIDTEIKGIVSTAKRNELVFGDRFPLIYFTEAYGLAYTSVFPGCSSETEPSASAIASIIKKVNDESIPVVFYLELSTGNIADSICEATNAQKMRFYTCHNVSATDFANGVTYLDLMKANVEALKIALN